MGSKLTGTVVAGYQVASGTGKDTPYPGGSIELQKPFFKASGLNLDNCFNGTLNIDISPKRFVITSAKWKFENVRWVDGFAAETFSFVPCELLFRNKHVSAFVYYPHPETKTQHFHNNQRLEILAPRIENINYGDSVTLIYDEMYLRTV